MQHLLLEYAIHVLVSVQVYCVLSIVLAIDLTVLCDSCKVLAGHLHGYMVPGKYCKGENNSKSFNYEKLNARL